MQAAPAVSVIARVPAWAAWAVGAACVLAALAAWAWAVQGAGAWRYAAPLAVAVVAGGWLAGWRARGPRRLRWDGVDWWLGQARHDDDGCPGRIDVAIDLQDRLLLRFSPQGGRAADWLPLQRSTTEGDWHALRCALHAGRSASIDRADAGALGA